MTTPRDSFCLFAWNYRELANSLLTLCDRSKGGFEPETLRTRVKWSNHSAIPALCWEGLHYFQDWQGNRLDEQIITCLLSANKCKAYIYIYPTIISTCRIVNYDSITDHAQSGSGESRYLTQQICGVLFNCGLDHKMMFILFFYFLKQRKANVDCHPIFRLDPSSTADYYSSCSSFWLPYKCQLPARFRRRNAVGLIIYFQFIYNTITSFRGRDSLKKFHWAALGEDWCARLFVMRVRPWIKMMQEH